ncbi:MAG: hypothetical protein GY863_25025 [bacterium]|nr:hypothetical protein [bacterium]
MAVLILLRAHSHVFKGAVKNVKLNSDPEYSGKICFWFIAVLTPVLMGSVILCMYPLFGMDLQKFLLTSHHISALLFLTIIFCYINVKTKSSITTKKQKNNNYDY